MAQLGFSMEQHTKEIFETREFCKAVAMGVKLGLSQSMEQNNTDRSEETV
jgi:hypothetical protein